MLKEIRAPENKELQDDIAKCVAAIKTAWFPNSTEREEQLEALFAKYRNESGKVCLFYCFNCAPKSCSYYFLVTCALKSRTSISSALLVTFISRVLEFKHILQLSKF